MGAIVQRGRHVVQDVHGVSRRVHARRRADLPRRCSARASSARSICMHAENGIVDRRARQAGAREGHTAPKYHALTRPAIAEAEGTHRAIALAEMADVPVYIVHLSAARALEKVDEARDRGLPAFAETCPQYLFLSDDDYEEPGLRGREVRVTPPLRAKDMQDQSVARARAQRPAGRLDRSLPVLHEGAEGARRRRLREDPERHARRRDAHVPALGRRRARPARSR